MTVPIAEIVSHPGWGHHIGSIEPAGRWYRESNRSKFKLIKMKMVMHTASRVASHSSSASSFLITTGLRQVLSTRM